MLSDYIEAYKEAMARQDKAEMKRIEKELEALGMDRYTLMTIIKDV